MSIGIVLDVVVAALLVTTIGYAMVLSRRLAALRNDKEQLEALIRTLDETSRRAESGVAQLRSAAGEIGRELQQRIDAGQSLKTDLSYMVELGSGLADRLESARRAAREEKPAAPEKERAETPRVEPRLEPREAKPARMPRRPVALEVTQADRPAATAETADADAGASGLNSRAERLLRRALEARR